jgi:hypothetical protein
MKAPVSTAIPKAEPKVDLDVTRERLAQLGLVRAAERLSEHVSQAAQDSVPPHRFLDRCSRRSWYTATIGG